MGDGGSYPVLPASGHMRCLFSSDQTQQQGMTVRNGARRCGSAGHLRATGDTVEPVTLTEVPYAELLEIVMPEFIARMAREERQFSSHWEEIRPGRVIEYDEVDAGK